MFFENSPALAMRGFMVCWHQIHDFMPLTGPGLAGLKLILKEMSKAKLNTLLAEYETMFPWQGEHSRISCKEHLTEEELADFLQCAKQEQIEVIPLVQILGHTYHLLIHPEYAACTEDPEIPRQLCPLSEAARKLAEELIDQTLALHPGCRYIHLGGDECEQLGSCPRCAEFVRQHGAGELFAQYMGQACQYALKKGVTPIIWHDVALRHPETLSCFDSRVLFHFWNYGDASHGSLQKPLHELLKYLNPQRIIGGSGARAEHQHGALHHSHALQENNICEMNCTMAKIGAKGSILTDWNDTGCSLWDSFYPMRVQAVSSWQGRKRPVEFRRKYAEFFLECDIPELPAYLDAIAGVSAFACGFQTRINHPLNRYCRKPYDFQEALERVKQDYFQADGEEELYRLIGKRASAQRLSQLLEQVPQDSYELSWFRFLSEVTQMFLAIDIGVRKHFFTTRYFGEKPPIEIMEQYQSRDYLRYVLSKWETMKSEYLSVHKCLIPEGILKRSMEELFPSSLYSGIEEILKKEI